ncbi:MAG: hypothetical protein MJZ38_03750 [archaeon]|nr:hypothetical protein [archaeon]
MVEIAANGMEAKSAPCRELKLSLQKVMVAKTDFVEFQEYYEGVSPEDAQSVFSDYEGFLKRNKFTSKNNVFLVEKIKDENDLEALRPVVKKFPTGWVDITKLNDSDREAVLANCSEMDRLNAWDLLSFEESDQACASCPLAWNKGKCIGTFGPATSSLPAIAEKYGCPIIASAITYAKERKKLTFEDAKELLRETEILKTALVDEGKMAVHRYSGPVERMNTLATACIKAECGFFFC